MGLSVSECANLPERRWCVFIFDIIGLPVFEVHGRVTDAHIWHIWLTSTNTKVSVINTLKALPLTRDDTRKKKTRQNEV